MEQSPFSEAHPFSTSQEIPRILCNPNVHYQFYRCPPPAPILIHINPVHVPHTHFLKINRNIISHLRLGSSSALFPSGFLTKILYTSLLFPIRATCPSHRILLDVITRTILGKEYRSLSSSLCSFLNYIMEKTT